MHYYQFNIADYRKETGYLSLVDHAIYRSLIDTYYLDESPLSSDVAKLMRTHCIRTASEKSSFEMVLKDFFTLETDGYHHSGCDNVLKRIYAKSEKARESANIRWKKNANALPSDSERNATGMLPIDPIPNNPIPIINKIDILFSESGMSEFQITELARIRKVNKGGKITERVAKSLINEFKLAVEMGWQLDDSLTEWESRGWKSFKSEWITPKTNGVSNEINGRPTTARPDLSTTGRTRTNAEKRRREIDAQLAEIERNDRPMAANVIDVSPQMDVISRG